MHGAIGRDGNCSQQMFFYILVAGSNPQGDAFFSFIPCKLFFSSIPLLLICISENENIGIVSISFIVIHT